MRRAESEYMGRVAALGCALCRRLGFDDVPAEIHHVRAGQGMSQRAQNWLVLPACPDCHRGPRGIHGDKSKLRQAKCDELDLLADTIERIFE